MTLATPTLPPPLTEGLSRFDQVRAASVADEGGASAAAVETQEPATVRRSPERKWARREGMGRGAIKGRPPR